jgi:hypothetical protein
MAAAEPALPGRGRSRSGGLRRRRFGREAHTLRIVHISSAVTAVSPSTLPRAVYL